MPDLFNALGELPDEDETTPAAPVAEVEVDPGMFDEDAADDPGADDAPAPTAAKAKEPTLSREEKRKNVESVLALLGRSTRPANAQAGSARSVLPSARARAAIERLVQLGTIEDLDATQPNLKAMCQDLFDWHNPDGQTRANGNVVKAFGRALTARDANGASLYSQAVEMAGFASAAAPLLQPDRLARIIDLAPTVSTAFGPERYTMQLTGALRTILVRYPEQRREQLLATLWTAAHDGRWWDMTSGIVEVRTGPVRRRRAAAADDLDEDDAEQDVVDVDQVVREVLAGAGVAEDNLEALTDALLDGKLPFNPATPQILAKIRPSQKLTDGIHAFAARMRHGDPVDPDIALNISHLPWLTPGERPESPLTWLAKTLVLAITPDPETGEVEIEALPEKPKEWKALYPLAELTGFPYPAAIRKLDRTLLPGTDGPGRTPVIIELIKNPAELAENRDYMGNCTWSYKDRLENGTNVLFKLWQGNDCYNVAIGRGNRGWGRAAHANGWSLWETNSRFNRGGVPAEINAGVDALIAALPPAGDITVREQRERRQIRYGAA